MKRVLTAFVAGLVMLGSLDADARRKRKRRRPAKPVPTFRADGTPNIQSVAAVALDTETGEVIFSQGADLVRPIASLSKLAAVLVIVEQGLKLDGQSIIAPEDVRMGRGGARSRLPAGFVFSNDDLLHAALLASDNRAISALGRSVGLDSKGLASAMTQKARSLGLLNTRFTDPVGLSYENVSTAREVIVLLREALANPLLAAILKQPAHRAVSVAPKRRAISYFNTNQLLTRRDVSALGGKTGFNARAGHCFVGAVRTTAGRAIIAAFLGSQGKLTRFGDFGRMLTWLSRNSQPSLATTNSVVPAATVTK